MPAPEADPRGQGAVEEALRGKREGKAETILFNLCGHGHFDMQAYMDYSAGKLTDQKYDESRAGDGAVRPAQRARTCLSGKVPAVMVEVRHNPAALRFEAVVDGRLCRADYRMDGDIMLVVHTEVPPALEGRGIAASRCARRSRMRQARG